MASTIAFEEKLFQELIFKIKTMAKEEKILTLHPAGKKGTNISLEKYNIIKDAMLKIIAEQGNISYEDLNDKMMDDLQPTFDGRVNWYVVTVKLDLEARGIIERIPKTSPHRVRLKKK